MKKITPSGFQFKNPKIKYLLFHVNENFDETKYEGLDVSYGARISEKVDSTAAVDLQIRVGEKSEKTPYFLELVIFSEFRWTDDIDGNVDSYLKCNATIALMSYARPIISHTTSDAGFRAFNLPFVDIRDDFQAEGN